MKNLARLENLLKGLRGPMAATTVFERAVAEHRRRYAELRKLVAEFLYIQVRQNALIEAHRAEVARLHHRALVAQRRGARLEAGQLSRARDEAKEALRAAERELEQLQDSATEASALLRVAGRNLSALTQESASAARAQRLHALDQRLTRLGAHDEPQLEQARLQVERMRAERRLNAELSGRYFPLSP